MKIINRTASRFVNQIDDLMSRVNSLIESPDPEAEQQLIADIDQMQQDLWRQVIESPEDFEVSGGSQFVH